MVWGFFFPTFFQFKHVFFRFWDESYLWDVSVSIEFHRSPAGAGKLRRTQQNILQRNVTCNIFKGRLQTETKCRPSQLIISRFGVIVGALEYFSLLWIPPIKCCGWGRRRWGWCWRWLRVPGVARCLTLTGADDECDLRHPQELTNSRESQHPAMKVSIFKGHQQQWESCGTARPPTPTARKQKFFQYSVFSEEAERAPSQRLYDKPRNVNLSGSLNQGWGLNLVQHTCDFFSVLVAFTLVHLIFQQRKLHLNQKRFSFQHTRMKEDGRYEGVKEEKWRWL